MKTIGYNKKKVENSGIERAIEIGAPASIIFDAKRQTGGVQVEVKGMFRINGIQKSSMIQNACVL